MRCIYCSPEGAPCHRETMVPIYGHDGKTNRQRLWQCTVCNATLEIFWSKGVTD